MTRIIEVPNCEMCPYLKQGYYKKCELVILFITQRDLKTIFPEWCPLKVKEEKK